MYTVHSRSHYTGLLWSVVRADYSNNTPLTHTCMERETGTVVGGAAGQRRDEVTERSMAGPSLESSPGQMARRSGGQARVVSSCMSGVSPFNGI